MSCSITHFPSYQVDIIIIPVGVRLRPLLLEEQVAEEGGRGLLVLFRNLLWVSWTQRKTSPRHIIKNSMEKTYISTSITDEKIKGESLRQHYHQVSSSFLPHEIGNHHHRNHVSFDIRHRPHYHSKERRFMTFQYHERFHARHHNTPVQRIIHIHR